MIHTINITYEFKHSDSYNSLFNSLKILSHFKGFNFIPKNKSNRNSRYWESHLFNNIGISSIIFSRHKGGKFTNCFIEILVNCPKLINHGNETGLAKFTDYNLVADNFKYFIDFINKISSTNEILPSNIDEWKTRRIDYAFDIYTDKVKYYLDIFNKGEIPRGFYESYFSYDSFHLKSKSYNYNFYNKTIELEQKHGITVNENILRLEVQCKTNKLRDIRKEYGLTEKSILKTYWNEQIAYDIIRKAIINTIGPFNFIKKSNLIETVKNAPNPNHSLTLINLINDNIYTLADLQYLISQNRLPDDIVKEYIESILDRKLILKNNSIITTYINMLHTLTLRTAKYNLKKLNLSPIAIPDNAPFEELENPIKLLK